MQLNNEEKIFIDKQNLRKKCYELGGFLSKDYKDRSSEAIFKKIIRTPEYIKAKNLFCFCSIDGEPDTKKLIDYSINSEKRVYIPLVKDDSIMKAVKFTSWNTLEKGKFGILEPSKDEESIDPSQIDLIIVPCVAASYNGYRLGHGRGYYDRFFTETKAYKMLITYSKFIFDYISTDGRDVIVDNVIDEKKEGNMSDCTHDCSSCSSGCDSSTEVQGIQTKPMNSESNIRKVIGVVSGKGGVGKSSVTSMLAAAEARKGKKVAILDADITGPSIPKAFGTTERAMGNGQMMLPVMTEAGVKIMSINLVLEDDTDPVVWRGSILGNVIEQFWSDVIWGDIDVMFIDMPPGTGDVALTVYQSLPVDGIVIVTSPQDLVSMIVEKAVKMAEMMNIPILGMVENMSYFKCPDCDSKHSIFGESHIEELTAKHNINNVAKLPIDMNLAKSFDNGKIAEYQVEEMEEFVTKL